MNRASEAEGGHVHVIRLRGPWDYRPVARTLLLRDGSICETPGPLPAAGRIQMPADWGATLGDGFRGRVLYTRRFGRPTGLHAETRVQLVIAHVDVRATVTLNGTELGRIPDGQLNSRWDVTRLLAARNQLCVLVDQPETTAESAPLLRHRPEPHPGGLTGEVRLEISIRQSRCTV
jgi:hypothetical protein